MKVFTTSMLLACLAAPVLADPAEILDVSARQSGTAWNFSVTLRHADTGWEDYADGWRVETLEGDVLGTRILFHPHVQEQPFTRSLGGVEIPAGTTKVAIRAKTLPDGWADSTILFELPER